MEVENYGPKTIEGNYQSDIYSITYNNEGLTILIGTTDENRIRKELRINFEYADGLRFLDEGDLMKYWESKAFRPPYNIFEILSGGWSNGEKLEPGILGVSSSVGTREWFIVTSNDCITVLCNTEPTCESINA